jgi:hypothetical protein
MRLGEDLGGTGQWAAPLFVEDDFEIVSVEQGKARPVGEAAIEFDASEVGWMLLDAAGWPVPRLAGLTNRNSSTLSYPR